MGWNTVETGARGGVFLLLVLLACVLSLASPVTQAADRPLARATPDWLRDGVVYEIYPRNFSREGTFKAIVPQLDRLQALGVNVLWLMPIHPIGRLKAKGTLGSPYAVRDYDAINPEFGTPAEFKAFVAAAHQRGMKVFIDVVANHTAWDAVLIRKHPDWFTQDAAGRIIPPNPDWVDVADLDWSSPGLRQYMTGMLVRWLRDYNLDGFRCDYASGVPTDYWNSLRPELDKVRPGLAFLAESDDPALLHSAFDIDYAWDFYHVMADALAGRKPASEVRAVWERAEAKYPAGALRLRFSDNHDQLRATGQFGLPAAMAASAVMFTLDGVPLLYNGMEIGDTNESAAPALFEDAPVSWEMAERRPHVEPYYQALAKLRRDHRVFSRGAVRWLRNDDDKRVLSYERAGDGHSLVVVVNLSSVAYTGVVEAPAGEYRDITPEAGVVRGQDEPARRAATLPALTLAPWEFRVFRRQ
jgi:cyclomaltodextrinase